MKPLASAITTIRKTAGSGTGMPLGEHGLETPASSQLVAWLSARSPAEVDAAVASRALSRGVELRLDLDHRFPRDAKGDALPMVTVVRSCICVGGTDEARQITAAEVAQLMAPAEARAIEDWLAELSVIVAKRADDEFTETLRVTAYASRLRRFPADVARAAVLDHVWKFWPSWAELEAVCERMVSPRRAVLQALSYRRGEKVQIGPRCTPEAAARIMREVWGDA